MGFWIRLAAWSIDAMPLVLLGFGLPDAAAFVVFLAWLSYRVAFTIARGQTLGKMVCRLQVVNANGEKPTVAQALARELLSPLSFYLVNLWVAADPNNRGWHDHLSRTYVIRQQALGLEGEVFRAALEEEVARRGRSTQAKVYRARDREKP